ncbi:hypothetical protein BayCH28_04560 [Mycolicibacterium sp. CH28]|uniref:hypothetical protein n=1 Tax=Mycolicibacterium sp. CH28 TaxID=2512237 RepID=UPI0010811168|nr:hypothetical protein [Mycolicibacterium sp. CH28]TGD89864.1 hypothetical protein BayCH28_04560 [Mycolicibacterium sp. CH28]
MTAADPDADPDAMLARIDADLPAPAVVRRDAILVTGPWLAGTSAALAALQERLPDCVFVEAADLPAGQVPSAVVFVVSATAPLTGSDCALLDAAAADTDAVIAVVSKIDVHRTWRQVLEADRALLADHDPRYADVPWVGAAAAPDLGAPVVDDLVEVLRAAVSDGSLPRRNRLRAWENRLLTENRWLDRQAAGTGREARLAVLREQRGAALQQYRLEKSERTIEVRSRVQQARVQLSYFARNRCTSVRTELQEDAAGVRRRGLAAFIDYVGRRIAEVADDVDEGVTRRLRDVGAELGLAVEPPVTPAPQLRATVSPLRSRRLETRLMVLLGAGFGLGVALTLSRLFADLAPRWTLAGAVGCAVIGVALTLWVIGVRGLLHDRAVLDRWVAEVTTGLRTAMEEWVATRVLAAESALSRAAAERDAVAGTRAEETVARIDREIREHTAARARAVATREQVAPTIARALSVVRAELAAN